MPSLPPAPPPPPKKKRIMEKRIILVNLFLNTTQISYWMDNKCLHSTGSHTRWSHLLAYLFQLLLPPGRSSRMVNCPSSAATEAPSPTTWSSGGNGWYGTTATWNGVLSIAVFWNVTGAANKTVGHSGSTDPTWSTGPWTILQHRGVLCANCHSICFFCTRRQSDLILYYIT